MRGRRGGPEVSQGSTEFRKDVTRVPQGSTRFHKSFRNVLQGLVCRAPAAEKPSEQ